MKIKSLVKKLIEVEDNRWMQLLAGLSFLVFFRLICGRWSYVLAIMMGMIGHEWGHKLVYWVKDVKTKILFLFPLGMVTMPRNEEEDEKSNKLSRWSLAWLMQAGVMVNVSLVLLGQCLFMFSKGWWSEFGVDLIAINGFLGLFNLLPVGQLDGGLLFLMMGSSLKVEERGQLSRAMVMMAGVLLGVVLSPTMWVEKEMLAVRLLGALGWLTMGVVFSAEAWFKGKTDVNLILDLNSVMMTKREVVIHFSLYMLLIFISASLLMGPLF